MSKILILIFSVLIFLFLQREGDNSYSSIVFITSYLIQIVSVVQMFSVPRCSYSLKKMFYMFTLFFLGFAPLLQHINGTSINGAGILSEREYIWINILILLIIIMYELFYNIFYSKRIPKRLIENVVRSKNEIGKHIDVKIILVSLVSFLIVFQSNNFDFTGMLIRGGELVSRSNKSLGASLVIGRLIRPIPMFSFLYYYSLADRRKGVLILLFFSAILTSFPASMARFQVAAFYIPFLLVLFPVFKKKNVFILTITAGLLFIFPFLNSFRYFTSDSKLRLGLNFDMFLQGHFDSYTSIAVIVSNDIVTWGRQLLGVFFFWIPRSIWYNKPIGSGAFIAELGYLDFANASANYFAEGYINFGFIGVAVFVIILAYFSAIFDKVYWIYLHSRNDSYFTLVYYLLIGMLLFILRGDLMSGFAYTLSFYLSFLIVHKTIRKNRL